MTLPISSCNHFKEALDSTPAMILDLDRVKENLAVLAELREQSGSKILYSIKALPFSSILELMKPAVDGFSVSSLFEAKLAREILADSGSIHLTTPGLRPAEWPELSQIITQVSFNSLSQYQQFFPLAHSELSCGIRLNPKLSFLQDDRFNPCRPHSKLGVAIEDFNRQAALPGVAGLHIHTVFSATSINPLQRTLDKLRRELDLHKFRWLNLGGGYLFRQLDRQQFSQLLSGLIADFDLEIYLEPGKALVNDAGYLVASVLDTFESDGKTVAVLDTSVNHHPEVFEFQRQPVLHEHAPDGCHQVLLVGSTCLAGDLFGEYRLSRALQVGDRVIFKEVGAYTLIKANRFNGYPLPSVYTYEAGSLRKRNQDSYAIYRQQWHADF